MPLTAWRRWPHVLSEGTQASSVPPYITTRIVWRFRIPFAPRVLVMSQTANAWCTGFESHWRRITEASSSSLCVPVLSSSSPLSCSCSSCSCSSCSCCCCSSSPVFPSYISGVHRRVMSSILLWGYFFPSRGDFSLGVYMGSDSFPPKLKRS